MHCRWPRRQQLQLVEGTHCRPVDTLPSSCRRTPSRQETLGSLQPSAPSGEGSGRSGNQGLVIGLRRLGHLRRARPTQLSPVSDQGQVHRVSSSLRLRLGRCRWPEGSNRWRQAKRARPSSPAGLLQRSSSDCSGSAKRNPLRRPPAERPRRSADAVAARQNRRRSGCASQAPFSCASIAGGSRFGRHRIETTRSPERSPARPRVALLFG